MNKQILIGIVAIIVVDAGYFFYSKYSGQPAMNSTQDKQTVSGMFKGTLQDLFARGSSMQCTFSNNDEGNRSEGTMYISGKKMAGNFISTQADGTVYNSNIVRDEQYGYTWFDGQKQGTKLKIKTSEEVMKGTENTNKDEVFALENKKVDYDCKPWKEDKAKFVPPSAIKFQDISSQVEQSQQTMKQQKKSQCDSCNQVPVGTAKEQCLQAFKCN